MIINFFLTILFEIFVSANFFIKNGFFATATTTDLTSLFSIVPYISILIIPALCYKNQLKDYNEFIPGNSLLKTVKRFLILLSQYVLMLLLLIFPCIFVAATGSVDISQFFTSELCLVLYGAAAISLCLFISEIFTNSILCFIISAIILALSNSAHLILVYLNPNQFFSVLIKNISFAWHFDSASKGILDTRDIFFFIILTLAFLYFSDVISKFKKGKILNFKQKYTNVITFIISLFLIIDSNYFYKRFDFSKSKKYSLSNYSTEVAKQIDDSLKITYYRSSNLTKYYPQIRDVSDFLLLYSNQNKKVSFTIKNPDKDSRLTELLGNYGITSQQLKNIKNTSTEYINVFSAVTLEYNGKTEIIPFIMDSETLEYDLDERINQLLTDKERIVNILVANGMSLQNDYSYIIPWLNSQGFICNELNLYSSTFYSELENTTGPLVVIGDNNLSEEDTAVIENYILSEKGNGFFALSPYSCAIENDWEITENPDKNLINLLSKWGLTFQNKIAADLMCSRIQLYSEDESSLLPENTVHTENVNYPLWIKVPGQDNFVSGLTLFWSVPMEINSENQVSIKPYLYTSSTSYNYPINYEGEKLIETNPFLVRDNGLPKNIKYENQIIAAEISGTINGIYTSEASSNTKILVVSDPYFVNTLMTGYNSTDYADYRNFDFLTNCLLRLNNENELADLQNKKSFDNSLNKISDAAQLIKLQTTAYFVLFILIPLLIVIIMIFLTVKNKNKYKKYYLSSAIK